MRADLSLQQAPPFSVPARFLVSAPLFGLIAALILLWQGPQIINHRWTPEILAVTHFLTLGFLAMSMLGAMMQLLPVLMGMVIPRPILFSSLIHTGLFLGSACLGLAWLIHIKVLFIIAMVLLGFSISVFSIVMIERLYHSESAHVTRSMMLQALIALLVTASVGIYLAMGHAWEDIPLTRQLTDLHLGWGLLGWVLLLVIAVAYQVIPMFQITDEYPVLHQRWLGLIIFTAMLGLSATYIWPMPLLKTVCSALLAASVMAFALTTLWILHNRRRQLPDLTLNFWRLSMTSLIVLVLSWSIATLLHQEIPVLLLGTLMIHGFAMTAVNGMMYKIIPFIIWLHLSARNKTLRDEGKREAQVKVPHMRKIIPEAAGMWQFRIHLTSVVLLALATLWPHWLFYPAAVAFVTAQAVLLVNLSRAALFYKAKTTEFSAQRVP